MLFKFKGMPCLLPEKHTMRKLNRGVTMGSLFDPAGCRVDYAEVMFCYGHWAREREKATRRQDPQWASRG